MTSTATFLPYTEPREYDWPAYRGRYQDLLDAVGMTAWSDVSAEWGVISGARSNARKAGLAGTGAERRFLNFLRGVRSERMRFTPKLKRKLLSLLAFGMLLPGALATPVSPASDLFERAVAQMNRYYNGYSDLSTIQPIQERATLQKRCGRTAQRCPASLGSTLLRDYVGNYYDDYMGVWTPTFYAAVKEIATGRVRATPTFGFTLNPLGDSQGVVLDVARGGPAERAGLQPGDRILRMNDHPILRYDHPLDSFSHLRLEVARGPVKRATLRTVSLTRTTIAPLYLPQLYVPAGAPKGVLVLRIPTFQYDGQVGPRVHQLVHEAQARAARGLVLDLRGGPGGNLYECEMAAGALTGPFQFKLQSKLGTFAAGWTGTRSPDGADRAFKSIEAPWQNRSLGYSVAHPARWTGKLAVLVDDHTSACHEYIAYILQQFGHVKVVGASTFGMLNTYPAIVELADGSALQLPVFRIVHTDGTPFPWVVTPDIPAFPASQRFADSGLDPMMQAAYAALALPKSP